MPVPPILGIDLGGGTLKICLGNSTGSTQHAGFTPNISTIPPIPSVMTFDARRRYFGEFPKESQSRNTIQSFKRLVSPNQRPDTSDPLASIMQRFQLSGPRVRYQVIAMMLGHVRRKVEQECGYSLTPDTVVAVPRWYTETDLQVLADSMIIAGLRPVGFITDIVAIALKYATSQLSKFSEESPKQLVAFLDIGQSDCTAAIVSFTESRMTVHEVITDANVGGEDVNRHLCEYLIARTQNKGPLFGNPEFYSILLAKCEDLKKNFSGTADHVWIDISNLTQHPSDKFKITKSEFRELLNQWLESVLDPLHCVLALSDMNVAELEVIEIVGGSTHLSCVLEYAQRIFGSTVKNIYARPDVSAAEGATYACSLIGPNQREHVGTMHDRSTPFEIPYRLNAFSSTEPRASSPWVRLSNNGRLDDWDLVSLIAVESAIEGTDELGSETEKIHIELVDYIASLSEELESVVRKTAEHESENEFKPLRAALDAALQWIVSTTPGERSKILYEAYLESLLAASEQLGIYIKPSAPANIQSHGRPETIRISDQERKRIFKRGHQLLTRFNKSKDTQELEECIECFQRALGMLQPNSIEMKRYLVGAGMALCMRFGVKQHAVDIHSAIGLYRQAVVLMKDSWEPDELDALRIVAMGFLNRFDFLGDLADVEEAIPILETVLTRSPVESPYRPLYLSILGTALIRRFVALGGKGDAERAEILCREAVRIPTALLEDGDDPIEQRLSCLNYLGIVLQAKFERSGEVREGDDAVRSCEMTVEEARSLHAGKPMYFNTLGTAFQSRFDHFGNVVDISCAVDNYEEAVRLADMTPFDRHTFLGSLGASLLLRYTKTGQLSDLERAAKVAEEAVQAIPQGNTTLAPYHTLGNSLLFRFLEFGQPEDINKAILAFEKSARLAKGHTDRPKCFTTLGKALTTRYEHLGDITDIEKAINVQRKGTNLLPDTHTSKPFCLSELATSLSRRFSHLFQMHDINEAIDTEARALKLLPKDHFQRPKLLMNFGTHHLTKYHHTKSPSDAEKAMKAHREAAQLLPSEHTDLGSLENNLASTLVAHFEQTGELTSLNEGIEAYKNALGHIEDHRPDKHMCYGNIGNALIHRFNQLHDVIDLDLAIHNLRKALELTPEDHTDRVLSLDRLGRSLVTRYKLSYSIFDIEEAILRYSEAARCRTGAPWTRFTSAKNWVICAKDIRHPTLRDAYDCWLDILPRVAWLGLKINDRREQIAKMGNIACDAAADAISWGDYETAIVWLEKGRFIIWSQGLQLRSPIDDLKAAYPDLARQVEDISAALEKSVKDGSQMLNMNEDVRLDNEKVSRRQRNLADAWDKTLASIRCKKGFEKFLLPKTFLELSKAAKGYPVAIVNPSRSRSDVLLLLSSGHVQHIPLSISYQNAENLANQMKSLLKASGRTWRESEVERGLRRVPAVRSNVWHDTLGVLWKDIAKPVIQALKLIPASDPPRLCWCPTGIFSRLPLHAAGDYGSKSGRASLHDYAISSYTPTLSLLLRPRQKTSDRTVCLTPSVLAIGVSETSISDVIASPLPMVKEEIRAIRAIVPRKALVVLEDERATNINILKEMKTCSCLHLACHAYQDLKNPINSAFLVHGEKLYLSQLINESLGRAELAFLSACQTARGDESTPDEAMHLAGAILFSGFRSVIGTMWSIDDADGPVVTKAIYAALFSRPNFDGRLAAKALHKITGEMKERQVAFEKWVPFISLGL